jgi:hypothetical protein
MLVSTRQGPGGLGESTLGLNLIGNRASGVSAHIELIPVEEDMKGR